MERDWVHDAIRTVEADAVRSADTHLITVPLPRDWEIDVYLKDESVHPTGSLKHRLARSLVLHGLCNGWIGPDTHLIENSSGSTAVSEAYFARLLDLPFTAVMPASTSAEKIALIGRYGGNCELLDDDADFDAAARALADRTGGHYLDQFTYAERATDWRGNNNIAESIFTQLSRERHPEPSWVVVGAGTGGTSATIGRFLRYRQIPTRLCLVDPEGSAYASLFRATGGPTAPCRPSRIEGIGRIRVEASFIPEIIDRAITVPDPASVAGVRILDRLLGRRVGASTGTNFWGVLQLCAEMLERGETGSIVSLICDGGSRYRETIYEPRWLEHEGIDPAPYERAAEAFLDTGAAGLV